MGKVDVYRSYFIRQGLSLPSGITPALLLVVHQLPTRTGVGPDAAKVFFHTSSDF